MPRPDYAKQKLVYDSKNFADTHEAHFPYPAVTFFEPGIAIIDKHGTAYLSVCVDGHYVGDIGRSCWMVAIPVAKGSKIIFPARDDAGDNVGSLQIQIRFVPWKK